MMYSVESETEAPAQRRGVWLLYHGVCAVFAGLIIANLLLFGIAMASHAFSTDLPWLFSTGAYLLEHQAIPRHDIFSWTFPDKPFVVYQWLFEVMAALLKQSLGIQGVLKLFSVLAVTIYVLIPLAMGLKKRIPLLFVLLPTTLALCAAAANLEFRPLFFTTGFLMGQYHLLQGYREGKLSLKRTALVLAILYALWANIHMGCVLGFLSLLLMAVGDWLDQQLTGTTAGPSALFKPYGVLFAAGFLASLLNPYGITLYAYLADLSAQSYLNDALGELRSPDFHKTPYLFLMAIIGLFVTLLKVNNRAFSTIDFLHLLVFTLLTLHSRRFVVWAALYYALILPTALHYISSQMKGPSHALRTITQTFEGYRPNLLTVIAVLLILPFTLPSQVRMAYGKCDPLMPGIKTYNEKLRLPTDRLFNDPRVGGCSLLDYPRHKVFIDTRLDFYGQAFTQEVVSVAMLGEGWQDFLQKWDINTVFVLKEYRLGHFLKQSPGYQTLYEDSFVIVLRKTPGATSDLGPGNR